MDPGSVILALIGCLISLIGLHAARFAREMEPAPLEGTLYEHASPRARERIYRATGLVLAITGAVSTAVALILGADAAVFAIAVGTAALILVYCYLAPRIAEEALLAEPPAPSESGKHPLTPPGPPSRLASGSIALLQLPIVARVFCSLLSSEPLVCASLLVLLEAPTVLLACYTLFRPDAYYTPGTRENRYKLAVLLSPPLSSLTPLGIALIAQGAAGTGLLAIAAGVAAIIALRTPFPRKR